MSRGKDVVSPETRQEAQAIARATQRPGQSKADTRLIAQGIEKGIAQYKKQQKAKAREQDKLRKRRARDAQERHGEEGEGSSCSVCWLPWGLLVLSWIAFAALCWLRLGQ